jgi:hypothetical protein
MSYLKMGFVYLFVVVAFVLSSLETARAASMGFYTPGGITLNWVRATSDPTVLEVYMSVNGGENQSYLVPKGDVELTAKKPVSGVFFGWTLSYNSITEAYEHCQVVELFESGRIQVFCDLQGKSRFRKYGYVNQYVGEVSSLGSFKRGQVVVLKQDFQDYKSGESLRIKALFPNGKALVIRNTIENFFRRGPDYDAISKVIDIEFLKAN